MAKTIIGCECDQNGNTGNAKACNSPVIGFALQNTIANNGTVNGIDISSAVTTGWTSLLRSPNKSQRLYPVIGCTNYAAPVPANEYETDGAGNRTLIRKGIKQITIEKWDVDARFVAKVNKAKCPANSIFLFTELGVIGRRDGNTFKGIELNVFEALLQEATNAGVAKMMVAADFKSIDKLEDYYFLTWEELNTTYSAQFGLIDATFAVVGSVTSDSTNTTVQFKLCSTFAGGTANPNDVTGLLVGDIVVTNKTTSTAITPVSLTEDLDNNRYVLVIPDQAASDVVEVKSALTATSTHEFVGTFVAV